MILVRLQQKKTVNFQMMQVSYAMKMLHIVPYLEGHNKMDVQYKVLYILNATYMQQW